MLLLLNFVEIEYNNLIFVCILKLADINYIFKIKYDKIYQMKLLKIFGMPTYIIHILILIILINIHDKKIVFNYKLIISYLNFVGLNRIIYSLFDLYFFFFSQHICFAYDWYDIDFFVDIEHEFYVYWP